MPPAEKLCLQRVCSYTTIDDISHRTNPDVAAGTLGDYALLRRSVRQRRTWQTGAVTTAASLAVALPATGLVIAVVIATWRATNGRMDEQGRRMDEQGRRLDNLSGQIGEVLRALGRLEGRRETGTPANA